MRPKQIRHKAPGYGEVLGTSYHVTDTAFKLKVMKRATESNNIYP